MTPTLTLVHVKTFPVVDRVVVFITVVDRVVVFITLSFFYSMNFIEYNFT